MGETGSDQPEASTPHTDPSDMTSTADAASESGAVTDTLADGNTGDRAPGDAGSGGVDSDGDGVNDDLDNCPNDQNPDQRDVCSSTTLRPGGGCSAALFAARPAGLLRPVLIVEYRHESAIGGEAGRPTCGESTPMIIPDGWRTVSSTDDRVYILADDSVFVEAGGGVEIPGVDVDRTRRPETVELGNDELRAVIEDSLNGPAASEVAAAVTQAAAETLSADTWRALSELNPALVVGGGSEQVVVGDDRDVAVTDPVATEDGGE